MFRRLVLENTTAIFTIVAFLTAAAIYLTFAWRALLMKRPQVARFENLPFETPTPSAVALRGSARMEEPRIALAGSRCSRSGLQESRPSAS